MLMIGTHGRQTFAALMSKFLEVKTYFDYRSIDCSTTILALFKRAYKQCLCWEI